MGCSATENASACSEGRVAATSLLCAVHRSGERAVPAASTRRCPGSYIWPIVRLRIPGNRSPVLHRAATETSTSGGWKRFYSSDYSDPNTQTAPNLTVTYAFPAPPVPTDAGPIDGPDSTVDTDPTMTGTYTDPAGLSGSIGYRLMNANCTTTLESGTGTVVADQLQSQWTPQSISLTLGSSDGVEAQAVDSTGALSPWSSCQTFAALAPLDNPSPVGPALADPTPTFTVQLDSSAGSSQQVYFTVGQIGSDTPLDGATRTVAPGGTVSWTVPAGTLTVGGHYAWDVEGDRVVGTGPMEYDVVPNGPVAIISQPVDGSLSDTDVPLVAATQGFSSVTSVQFIVDGATYDTVSASPWSSDWDAFAPGTHTVSAAVTGVANGNTITVTTPTASFDYEYPAVATSADQTFLGQDVSQTATTTLGVTSFALTAWQTHAQTYAREYACQRTPDPDTPSGFASCGGSNFNTSSYNHKWPVIYKNDVVSIDTLDDCANFVSQIIHYAGFRMDNNWYMKRHYVGGGAGATLRVDS